MKRRILVIAAVLGVAGLAAAYIFQGFGRANKNRLVVSGNIELREVNIAFKTSGRLIERNVDEGDNVKKGQILARLDRDQLLAERAREVAALQAAETQVEQAETSIQWQKANLAGDLEQKRGDLAGSESKLLELKNGSRPQEIHEASAAVDAAKADWDRTSEDWERAQTLYKNDDISAEQRDQYRNRWQNAQAALKQAQERAALVLAGPRSEQIVAQAAQVQRARGALKVAEANVLELRRREQELAMRRSDIAQAKAGLALIDSQLADTIALSPADGVVLVKAADPGEVLAPGTTVVTVGDIDHPWLRGYIDEKDLGRVKLGSKAKVTTDSYPGKVYQGRVSFISSEAEFTPKQIQTQQERVKLVYRIKIDVENPGRELKSNMPADAEILAE
jgi:HlyD family secretion protein